MGQYFLVLGGTGSVQGGNGCYMVVLRLCIVGKGRNDLGVRFKNSAIGQF